MTLSNLRLGFFSSPYFTMAAFLLPLTIFLPPFYAEVIGIDLKVIGTVFLLAKLWDVATDIGFGYLSDRFPTRWGRRRPWLVAGAPLMMVCTYMIFVPQPGVSSTYLFIWLLLAYIGWTMITLSHLSWSAELSGDYLERSRIQAWLKAFGIAGMLFVVLVPVAIENIAALKGASVVNWMGIFIIIALPITISLAVFTTAEPLVSNKQHVQRNFGDAMQKLFANKALLRLLGSTYFISLSNAMFAAMFIFYAKYVLQLGSGTSVALILYLAIGFISIPAWIWLGKRVEKHNVFIILAAYGIFALLLALAVPSGDKLLGFLMIGLIGFNFGIQDILPKSMMADVTDLDLQSTKQARSGLFFGMLLTAMKLSNACAVGIIFWSLSIIGFEPGPNNSDEVLQRFTYMFVFMPIIANVIVLFLMRGYPLTQRIQQETREALAAERL